MAQRGTTVVRGLEKVALRASVRLCGQSGQVHQQEDLPETIGIMRSNNSFLMLFTIFTSCACSFGIGLSAALELHASVPCGYDD